MARNLNTCKPWQKKKAGLLPLGLVLVSFSALADTPPFSLDSPWLMGDWGGYRQKLADDGVDFQVGYTMQSAANLAGGYRTATTMRYADQWTFGSTLDLDKLLNWQGGTFQATITNRTGQNLTSHINDPRTGGLSNVQGISARGDYLRLTQFWLNQSLFNNWLDVKLGRVTTNEDFDTAKLGMFQNWAMGSGQPGHWRNDRWFNAPISQWGGRVKLNLPEDLYLQVGIYNQNKVNNTKANGFRFDMRHGEGNLVPMELGWQPKLGADGLQGNYRLGGYYSSTSGGNYSSWHDGKYGKRNHAYGGYLLAEQRLTATGGDNTRGLGINFQYIMNDHRTSKLDNYQSLALTWAGPFDARPKDEIGIGMARIHVNHDYAKMRNEQNQDKGVSDYHDMSYMPLQKGSEWNYEVYYNVKATRWLSIRPNLQLITKPGGVDQVQDAFVGGIAGDITF
ncbi:carbohydrate porin [Erwinia sp. S43]|uniref:carbohydrate porin n=1 Tax=Erwinia sp. S43 TaxID=2769339 RepID=UPI00190C0B4E|nr:carbohydrate porin [Erwinia sp. S43]MBK0032784.1 carbohydrate porin [Erwinia sp. S43]